MSPSAAATALSRRSVQCSFSSIFHLQKVWYPSPRLFFPRFTENSAGLAPTFFPPRQAGLSAHDYKLVTNVFKTLVIAPMAACGACFIAYKLSR